MAFKRLQEQAYEHLRDMVLNDSFERGTIYSETKIAESLGISRTPTRDALQKLSHDGLIDIMPSKGFRIHEFTQRDAVEIHQMRCAIEGYCVRLLAQQVHTLEAQQLLAGLVTLITEQQRVIEKDGGMEDFTNLDFNFHMDIISFAHNDVFTNTFQNQIHRIRMIATNALVNPARMQQSLAEHAALLEIVKQGQPDNAYSALLTHYQNLEHAIYTDSV